jgi:hypothetical protein
MPLAVMPDNWLPLPMKYKSVVMLPVAPTVVKLPEAGVTLPMGMALMDPDVAKIQPWPLYSHVLLLNE